MKGVKMFEAEYKKLLMSIIENNDYRPNRTGTNTYAVFGRSISIDLDEGFPILTGKQIYPKNFIHEFIWFVSGNTNINYLKNNSVNIWNKWADEKGDLGPTYGAQLRAFGGKKDQLMETIHNIKNDPYSRRHIITLWNPNDLEKMALPPCHFAFQFWVKTTGELNLNVIMRSCDAFVGLPYDIPFYALMLIAVAAETGLKPNKLLFNFTDLHIYENHMEGVLKYMGNPTHKLPQMIYSGNIFDLDAKHFFLKNYVSEAFIKAPVAI